MTDIAIQRLYNQQLEQAQFQTPCEVVAWQGAMQAQDYPGAKWALGLRLPDVKDADIEQAFENGDILRTHVMRPTWHFVAPADIRWIVDLTAPRVNAVNAYMYRKFELDDAIFQRSNAALIKALQGGKQLTRTELASVLEQTGIVADGFRLSYLMMRAELDGVICSGGRRGKQFTYALLDERAPQARILKRDEALAELTRRYFTSHGPALVEDFAWWSGLTKADVKAGIEMIGTELIHERIDGQTYWFSASMPPAAKPPLAAYLLPTYDEYLIAFASADRGRMGGEDVREKLVFDSTILMSNRIVGSWRRTFRKGAIVIESAPFRPFTTDENDAFVAAAERYGAFFGMPVVLH
jgi:hypothetical protein